MEALLGIPADLPYRERAGLLSSRGVALWDVVGSCSREGSGDSAIRDPVVNDIPGFIRAYPSLSLVILNGGTAGRLFHRILGTGLPPSLRVVILPSTSPANARFTLPKLAGRWSILRGFTRE
jgi:hypoxanthine-DNA glycosylase